MSALPHHPFCTSSGEALAECGEGRAVGQCTINRRADIAQDIDLHALRDGERGLVLLLPDVLPGKADREPLCWK